MKRPIVQCQHCKGSGVSELSTPLFDTLLVVTRSWQSTKEIFAWIPDAAWIKITALNNRLVELQKLKLVECSQRGKAKYWRIKR